MSSAPGAGIGTAVVTRAVIVTGEDIVTGAAIAGMDHGIGVLAVAGMCGVTGIGSASAVADRRRRREFSEAPAQAGAFSHFQPVDFSLSSKIIPFWGNNAANCLNLKIIFSDPRNFVAPRYGQLILQTSSAPAGANQAGKRRQEGPSKGHLAAYRWPNL